MSDEHDISYRDLAEAEDLADAVAAGTVTFDLGAPTPELPPRLTDEPMVVISARVPTSTYTRIRDEAAARGFVYPLDGRTPTPGGEYRRKTSSAPSRSATAPSWPSLTGTTHGTGCSRRPDGSACQPRSKMRSRHACVPRPTDAARRVDAGRPARTIGRRQHIATRHVREPAQQGTNSVRHTRAMAEVSLSVPAFDDAVGVVVPAGGGTITVLRRRRSVVAFRDQLAQRGVEEEIDDALSSKARNVLHHRFEGEMLVNTHLYGVPTVYAPGCTCVGSRAVNCFDICATSFQRLCSHAVSVWPDS